ncbi:MAG: hypothetical protein U0V74_08175 [Chitinophagales bacterium]
MKYIKYISSFLLFIPFGLAAGQGVLEYHGENSVQRMPDGANFRFLHQGATDDTLEYFSSFFFEEYTPGDTVIWQYVPSDDQLYIVAWDPKKAGKKHDIKFAVAWRVTSGNPRHGKVSVPGNLQFEGFGGREAYFTEAGKSGYLKLFFFETYVPGLAIVEYDLKAKPSTTLTVTSESNLSRENNFNYTGNQVPNPFSYAAYDRKHKQEEDNRVKALSVPLFTIQDKISKQPDDEFWGKAYITMGTYDNGYEWTDYDHDSRDYSQVFVYVEDKYYTKNTLNATLVSKHPELFESRDLSFESFYHQNGVTGWKVVMRLLPYTKLKLKLEVPAGTPVLTIRYDVNESKTVKDYLAAESKYADNKNVQAIVKAQDAQEKAYALWGTYALDHSIPCTAEELKAVFKEIYMNGGGSFDGYGSIGWNRSNNYAGTISPKYQSVSVVVISPVEPVSLMVSPGSGFKYKDVTLKELDKLPAQHLKVFTDRFQFEKDISGYDFKLDPGFYGENGYILFFSHPDKQ